MIFDKIIIIGNGTIALEILKILSAHNPLVISYNPHPLSILKSFCAKHQIFYDEFTKTEAITDFLSSFDMKTLIISANNHYIFPKTIINKPKMKIINFHNALLPLYKGVNAPIWSIYNQDKKAGITWHMVSPELDSGNIIAQKQITLSQNIKSIELIKTLMQLGIECFREFKDNLLKDTLTLKKMPPSSEPIKKSNHLPNDGFLDISWDEDKISAFLRSMDAGGIIPKPKILIGGNELIIESYDFAPIFCEKNFLLLVKDNIRMLLKPMGGGGQTQNR